MQVPCDWLCLGVPHESRNHAKHACDVWHSTDKGEMPALTLSRSETLDRVLSFSKFLFFSCMPHGEKNTSLEGKL